MTHRHHQNPAGPSGLFAQIEVLARARAKAREVIMAKRREREALKNESQSEAQPEEPEEEPEEEPPVEDTEMETEITTPPRQTNRHR